MTASCCQVDTLHVEETRPPVVLKKALENLCRRMSTAEGGIYYTISKMQLWFHFCDNL
jgi:hypothetical protein